MYDFHVLTLAHEVFVNCSSLSAILCVRVDLYITLYTIVLGVAFEQGKTLPTPETVPFRLTRDIVDGMGIAGVEGVFRRCCEETMSLMRLHQEELRTIVEVRKMCVVLLFM